MSQDAFGFQQLKQFVRRRFDHGCLRTGHSSRDGADRLERSSAEYSLAKETVPGGSVVRRVGRLRIYRAGVRILSRFWVRQRHGVSAVSLILL